MKLANFNFDLPPELIAQQPSSLREHSSLLIPNSYLYKIVQFFEILDYLRVSDLLVLNDSKVINAKLTLISDKKKVNINLNKPKAATIWLAFARPAKKLIEGELFTFGNHKILISKKLEDGEIELEFLLDNLSVFDFLDKYGEVPIPQYIKRTEQNKEDEYRYQNVYAKIPGSVAAPTAGLHFSKELLDKIREKGIETRFVTLQVGAGTFLPVKVENIYEHKMHSEFCQIDESTAYAINRAKLEGRRIIVVGTTVLRTLESCVENEILIPKAIETNIFITPGYKFKIADVLVTNFHLPKSTLFILVCAFGGIQKVKNIYKYAISNRIRFFSYGDAMILERKRK